MGPLAASRKVPVILMHMRGTPRTMQETVHYDDVVGEIVQFLKDRIALAVSEGIDRERLLIDPGIGFGKRVEDNWTIIKQLSRLTALDCPIVAGSSRKSFIKKTLGEEPHPLLLGSVATALMAAARGASLLRVHDVKETKSLIRL